MLSVSLGLKEKKSEAVADDFICVLHLVACVYFNVQEAMHIWLAADNAEGPTRVSPVPLLPLPAQPFSLLFSYLLNHLLLITLSMCRCG